MRELGSDTLTLLAARVVRLEYLYEGIFTSQTIRFWSGIGPLTWHSQTWDGNGWLLLPANWQNAITTDVVKLTIKLSGIPEAMIALILNDSLQQHIGRFYIAFFDADETLVHCEQEFLGNLGEVTIDEGASDSMISLTYENQLARLNEDREPRWTDAQQQAAYPGDLGYQYVAQLQQRRISWGRPDTSRGA